MNPELRVLTRCRLLRLITSFGDFTDNPWPSFIALALAPDVQCLNCDEFVSKSVATWRVSAACQLNPVDEAENATGGR